MGPAGECNYLLMHFQKEIYPTVRQQSDECKSRKLQQAVDSLKCKTSYDVIICPVL